MNNLDRRVKDYNVVINKPNRMNIDDFNKHLIFLNEELDKNGYYFACLMHDKDVDKDNKPKTLHIHYVIWGEKRTRLITMLWRLVAMLRFEDSDFTCIQIDTCDSIPKSIQYLTHKNHPNKFQYNEHYIVTNVDKKTFIDLYDYVSEENITTQKLYRMIVRDKMCDLELMFKLGASRYIHYMKIISEIRYITKHENNRVYADNLAKLYDDGEMD